MEFIKATFPACPVTRTLPLHHLRLCGTWGGGCPFFRMTGHTAIPASSYICKRRNPNINTQRQVLNAHRRAHALLLIFCFLRSFTFWNSNAKWLNKVLGETASRNSIQSRERGLQFHLSHLLLFKGFII